MIKRTHKEHIRKLLKENPEWNILDLGCGRFAWEEAQTLSDLVDHSELYPQKRFVKCDASETPFEDKEFDFVIASHITEHIRNLDVFLNELSRISKHGYIEVPLPLFDNLTYGNREEHIWWVGFDDVKHEITFMPKAQLIQERILPVELPPFEQFFRSSMTLELHWKDSIEWRIGILPAVLDDDLTYDIWPEPHSDNWKQQGQLGVLRKKRKKI
tara:strand:+ start:3450 stop:4091 length:642 start_codon:yes stop_codon:yes gene_type:complete